MWALNARENMRGIVITPGLFYGQGESRFYNLFKQVWLQDPNDVLKVVDGGDNFLPTVHVSDCAKLLKHIVFYPNGANPDLNPLMPMPAGKPKHYICVDDERGVTQKNLLETVGREFLADFTSVNPAEDAAMWSG